MQILASKLAEQQREARDAELTAMAGPKALVGWGAQIRSYVLAPYQQVKDLRTDYETGNVQAVLDGDLDPFMEAYLRWRRAAAAGLTPAERCLRGYNRRPMGAGWALSRRPTSFFHDQVRERHQVLQGHHGRPAGRQCGHPEGRVRLPGRPVRLRASRRSSAWSPRRSSPTVAGCGWPARRSGRCRPGRSRTCAATSAACSRTSGCCRPSPCTRTWRSRSR